MLAISSLAPSKPLKKEEKKALEAQASGDEKKALAAPT